MDVYPSHMWLKRVEKAAYADDLEREDRSNELAKENGQRPWEEEGLIVVYR